MEAAAQLGEAGIYWSMLDEMWATLAEKEIFTSQTLMGNYLSGGSLTYAKPQFLRAMVDAMDEWGAKHPEHAFPTLPMKECIAQLPVTERSR